MAFRKRVFFPSGPKVAELRITEGLQSTAALEHYQHSTANRAVIVRNAEQLPGADMKLHPSLFILILCLEMSSAKIPFFFSASFLNAVLVTKSSFKNYMDTDVSFQFSVKSAEPVSMCSFEFYIHPNLLFPCLLCIFCLYSLCHTSVIIFSLIRRFTVFKKALSIFCRNMKVVLRKAHVFLSSVPVISDYCQQHMR